MVDGVIVDLDGTVYRGDELIPGAERAVERLRSAASVIFVTNKPTRTPASVAAELTEMGLAAGPEEILTSTAVTLDYLRSEHEGEAVFPVAEVGVTEQFEGLDLTDDPTEAEVLVAAIDRSFTYDSLDDALTALRDGSVAFVGTDPDRTIPGADGDEYPGSGAIIGAISATVERDPDAVLGKPSERMADAALSRLGVDPAECLLIGDRLDTDIAMGDRAGATTALVLTGTHDRDAVEAATVTPDHVLASIADAPELLE